MEIVRLPVVIFEEKLIVKKMALLGRYLIFFVSLCLNNYPSLEIWRFHFVDRVELNTLLTSRG